MMSSLKKARALQIAGISAMLLALLNDSYFHLGLPLFALVVVTGSACLIISYRNRRRSTPAPAVLTMQQRHRAFVILLAASFLGCLIAALLLPPATQPVEITLAGASVIGR